MSSSHPPLSSAAPLAAAEPRVHGDGRPWWLRLRGQWTMLLLAPFLLWMLSAPPLFRPGTWPALAFQLVGWTLFLCGGMMRFWATMYMGAQKGKALVFEGPYSLCRNPLYLGTTLMTLSLAVLLQSGAMILGCLTAGTLYLWTTIAAEERILLKHLGEPYAAYLKRVPRFFPSTANFETPKFIEVNLVSMAIECRRAMRWIWIPLIAEWVNLYRLGELSRFF